jgi:mRNA-degrading endonuclease RelE of RelBE toxin-antitoxin system
MNEIVLTERLREDYKSLPTVIQKKLKKQIKFLTEDPKHRSLQIHRIEGTRYLEFYVDITYRCVFRQGGNVYYLLAVGPHKVVDEFSRK